MTREGYSAGMTEVLVGTPDPEPPKPRWMASWSMQVASGSAFPTTLGTYGNYCVTYTSWSDTA